MIRKGLITERLRKKIEGFKSVRTCQVISIEPTTATTELGELDIAILKAIELGCVPENLDSYRRADYKLKAVQKAIDAAKKRKEDKDIVKDEGIVG